MSKRATDSSNLSEGGGVSMLFTLVCLSASPCNRDRYQNNRGSMFLSVLIMWLLWVSAHSFTARQCVEPTHGARPSDGHCCSSPAPSVLPSCRITCSMCQWPWWKHLSTVSQFSGCGLMVQWWSFPCFHHSPCSWHVQHQHTLSRGLFLLDWVRHILPSPGQRSMQWP